MSAQSAEYTEAALRAQRESAPNLMLCALRETFAYPARSLSASRVLSVSQVLPVLAWSLCLEPPELRPAPRFRLPMVWSRLLVRVAESVPANPIECAARRSN